MSDQEQRNDFAEKQAHAAKDREIYSLRQQLERAERAAGRVATDKQRAWADVSEELGVEAGLVDAPRRCLEAVGSLKAALEANRRLYHEHAQDVIRLEALVERHGLNAMDGREGDAREMVSAATLYGLAHRWRAYAADGDTTGETFAGDLTECVSKNVVHVVTQSAPLPAADEHEPSVGDVAEAAEVKREPYRVGSRVQFRWPFADGDLVEGVVETLRDGDGYAMVRSHNAVYSVAPGMVERVLP